MSNIYFNIANPPTTLLHWYYHSYKLSPSAGKVPGTGFILNDKFVRQVTKPDITLPKSNGFECKSGSEPSEPVAAVVEKDLQPTALREGGGSEEDSPGADRLIERAPRVQRTGHLSPDRCSPVTPNGRVEPPPSIPLGYS